VSSAGLGIADELDGGVVLRSLYWRVSFAVKNVVMYGSRADDLCMGSVDLPSHASSRRYNIGTLNASTRAGRFPPPLR
jgi:hypothetical protein